MKKSPIITQFLLIVKSIEGNRNLLIFKIVYNINNNKLINKQTKIAVLIHNYLDLRQIQKRYNFKILWIRTN